VRETKNGDSALLFHHVSASFNIPLTERTYVDV